MVQGRSWCDGCLGSGQCWICGGDGVVDRRSGPADCPSCATSGICHYCAIPRQPQPQLTISLRDAAPGVVGERRLR